MTVWPASAVDVPLRVRSCAASAAFSMLSPLMVLMVTAGAAVSTLNACEEEAALPFMLVTLTCTLASPSFRPLSSAAGTVQVQSPWASTIVVRVLPAKIMVTVWPASTFEEEPDSTRSSAFFCRVQHVVVRHAVDAYRHRGEIDIHHGTDVHRVAGGILRAGADGERSIRPPGDVRGRNRSLPVPSASTEAE